MLKIFAYVNLRLVTDRSTGPKKFHKNQIKKQLHTN